MKLKPSTGFTVIELLVVIGIIAVLSAVSLFGLSGSRESARDARRKTDLETIRTAVELYRADCGSYPMNSAVISGNSLRGTELIGSCLTSNVYSNELPSDPASGNNYLYQRLTNFTYRVCAHLETETGSASCSGSCGGDTCNFQVNNP